VKEVVDELRGEVREMLKISGAELLDFLVAGIVTPVGDIDENHRLCQSVKSTDVGVVEVKMPNKIDLVREVNRMCGFYDPEKIKLTAEGELLEAMKRLTGAKQ